MAEPVDGEVRKIGVEECVVVWSEDAELWTLFTEEEQEGYLGEFDTVSDAVKYARGHYEYLKRN